MRLRTVILIHELPDGSSHLDWMFADEQPTTGLLRTWRCFERPDIAEPGSVLNVERLADHRAAYLDYEGPISGNRGCVERIATGWWSAVGDGCLRPGAFWFTVEWVNGPLFQQWVLDDTSACRLA